MVTSALTPGAIRWRQIIGRMIGPDSKATLKCLHWSLRQALDFSTQPRRKRWRDAAAAAAAIVFGRRRYLVCLPWAPYHDSYILGKICGRLRLRPTTNLKRLSRHSPLVIFKDATYFEPELPSDLPEGIRVLNARATDIRKSNVERGFHEVFGRHSLIDPRTFRGAAVEKSEENAAHDGRIVECPLSDPRPDRVYQRLINNIDDDGHAVDIRISVIGDEIPVAYVKRRSIGSRFIGVESAKMTIPDTVLSDPEIKLLKKFARSFGLDFGEMDVLRDRDDAQIYIVDVNNTPFGPSTSLPHHEIVKATDILTSCFHDQFLT